jgi:hypothetical protein
MATASKPGRSSTGRAAARTGRVPSAGHGRFARNAMTRTQGMVRRRPPEPTGMKKVVAVVGGALPTAAAKKAAPSSKKGAAGGIALLAAAAGMAIKNRDKLSAMRHRGDGDSGSSDMQSTTRPNNTAMPPSTDSM